MCSFEATTSLTTLKSQLRSVPLPIHFHLTPNTLHSRTTEVVGVLLLSSYLFFVITRILSFLVKVHNTHPSPLLIADPQ